MCAFKDGWCQFKGVEWQLYIIHNHVLSTEGNPSGMMLFIENEAALIQHWTILEIIKVIINKEWDNLLPKNPEIILIKHKDKNSHQNICLGLRK